ncbi:MAG: insulinase family protein [Deltaproteobacteria bacterium]|nr:insulinase family protein [Deltaproteobacteria bacterium]
MNRKRRLFSQLVTLSWVAALIATVPITAAAQPTAQVPIETFELDNGMRVLTVHRPELASVYAGWVAHVGSANERPGITGISHFFEHMMFKGTHIIGTRDIERDLAVIAEQEEVQEKIRAEYRKQRERSRLGEIGDPFDDQYRTPELEQLEQRFRELVEEQRALMVKDEYDQIYTNAGASSLNAFTTHDLTAYFISVPANKLELWFWMESDRLSSPVFREFYSERDVVYEERRLRTESTPTGKFDEMLDSLFWQSHPYSWPVVGWPSDLESYTQAQADEYFATYYAPNNLTAILVGNFDPERVRELAQRYMGRLPRGEQEPPDVVTMEVAQNAEKRMIAHCDCQPQIEVRYHGVPFRHRDSYALDVLAALLNGSTGRLYKALVLEQEIASSASSRQDERKWAGLFSLHAESRGDATPEQLEQALYAEIRKLQEAPVADRELQKVKNRISADAYRRLQQPFFLLFQLMLYDGLGDYQYINQWSEKTLAVTAEDVQRVAKKYFQPENRAVGLYYRKAGTNAEEIPPELAELPEPVRQSIQSELRKIRAEEDPAVLEGSLSQLAAQKGQMPPQYQPAFSLLEKEIGDRLKALKEQPAADDGGES